MEVDKPIVAPAATAASAIPGASATAGAATGTDMGTAASTDMGTNASTDMGAGTNASTDATGLDVRPFRAVGFTVSSVGYAVARRFRETLAPLELEPREFALLRAVGAAEGLSQQAAAERLQIPPSRMVAFVDALEARGLLERRHNPLDRRTRTLYLTTAGRGLLARALELAVGLERHLCAQLNGAERELLLELLARVGSQLGLAAGTHAALAHAALAHE
jgi:DNA-binding MarR family transcriptional regulator